MCFPCQGQGRPVGCHGVQYNLVTEQQERLLGGGKEGAAVQSLGRVRLLVTLWTAAHQASLPFSISQSQLKLMSIEFVMSSNHLILCHLLHARFPSIRVFSHESTHCIRWPKFWSFSIRPSNEYSELISFRMDWLDPLAVQGTLKSPLQHDSSTASILRCSAFFMVQLSHLYMTAGKIITLTTWTFVGKMMSLLFNMLSRFAYIFFQGESVF